ncbi:MAG: P-loop NTPase [Rhodothermales bacterium]
MEVSAFNAAQRARRGDTQVFAITSGKGGVGKSVVAVNLAEALAAQGQTVALIDADFGQGACALLMNEAPRASLIDYVTQTARVDDVVHQTETGVLLVQAVADPGQADGREADLYRALDALLKRFRRQCDVVLIDTPAGTEGAVRWALDRADQSLLVLVGEPTAITDAYRLVKLVWQADPAYPFSTLVNVADDETDAKSVHERFCSITQHFLQAVPNYTGWVPFSLEVRRSVREQEPAVRYPCAVQKAFYALAKRLHTPSAPIPSLASL